MDSENTWQRLVAAATAGMATETDRTRRTLLSEAMDLGTSITAESVGCSVTQATVDGYRTPVASNSLALDLDGAQYARNDGPCMAACRDGRVHSITVMTEESGYGEFTRFAVSHGVRSSLSMPLADVPRPSALNLYARGANAFEAPRARAVAELLARCVAALLAQDPATAGTGRDEGARATRTPEPATHGNPDAEAITAALALLRERDGLDDPQAFAELVRRSQRTGGTTVAVARELLAGGTGSGRAR